MINSIFFYCRGFLFGSPMCKSKRYPMHNSELRLHPNCAFDKPCFVFTHGIQKQICSVFHMFPQKMTTKLKIYSCIQMFALNLMEILKMTIYTTKKTKNTKLNFSLSHFPNIHTFQIIDMHNNHNLCRFVWHH